MNNDIIDKRTSLLWRKVLFVLLGLCGAAALYTLSSSKYLLYHALIELFAVGVAVSVFSIGWNTRHIVSSNILFLLAVAYGCVAGLDLLHTLASELTFTLYTDIYGFFNFLGHLLKLVSVFFIYRALVSDLLLRPYEGLFRDLARKSRSSPAPSRTKWLELKNAFLIQIQFFQVPN